MENVSAMTKEFVAIIVASYTAEELTRLLPWGDVLAANNTENDGG